MKNWLLNSTLRLLFQMDHTDLKSSRAIIDRASGLIPTFLLKDVRFDAAMVGNRVGEWVLPKGAEKGVLLYFHGGGFVTGSINSHRALVTKIAQAAHCKALIIDYRLAPEDPFPAALEDAFMAYEYLLKQGYNPKEIVLAGDSAGGGLSMSLLLKLKSLEMEMPSAAALLCPWVDLTNSGISGSINRGKDPIIKNDQGNFWAAAYGGNADLRSPLISPLFGELSGLPPIYIQAGGKDLLLSDATRLRDKLKEAEVNVDLDVYPEMFHVWQAFWIFLDESKTAIRQIGNFLSAHLVK